MFKIVSDILNSTFVVDYIIQNIRRTFELFQVGFICLIAVAFAAPTEKSNGNDPNGSVLHRTSISSESHGHNNPTYHITTHSETVSEDGKKNVQHHERTIGIPYESDNKENKDIFVTPSPVTSQQKNKEDQKLRKRDIPVPLVREPHHHSSEENSSEEKSSEEHKDSKKNTNAPKNKQVKRSPIEKQDQAPKEGHTVAADIKQTQPIPIKLGFPASPVDNHKQDGFSQSTYQHPAISHASDDLIKHEGANNHEDKIHKRSNDHHESSSTTRRPEINTDIRPSSDEIRPPSFVFPVPVDQIVKNPPPTEIHSNANTKSDQQSSTETIAKAVEHHIAHDAPAVPAVTKN